MIYGLIPIGGQGSRLGLPFSKELLPQKNFNYYNPVGNHVISKMKSAGADKIYFIHGLDFKQDVMTYFHNENYHHVRQNKLGVTNVLADFYQHAQPNDNDKILFGLPDTVFSGNTFRNMLNIDGIVCTLFIIDDNSKVDRLSINGTEFQVKASKSVNNMNMAWGTIKFDGIDIKNIINDRILDLEIGDILNLYPNIKIYGKEYFDLGTWISYNNYIMSNDKGI